MQCLIKPVRYTFREPVVVARGSYSGWDSLYVELSDAAGNRGRAECCPTEHYGESVEGVCAQMEAAVREAGDSLSREWLLDNMAAGAGRNGLDGALWDLDAKRSGRSIWELVGRNAPVRIPSAFTLSLATPGEMASKAAAYAHYPTLKLKLGADGDEERLRAVRASAPSTPLAVDANEGWDFETLLALLPLCEELGVTLIEQPLPAASDEPLAALDSPIPIAADESCHTRADLDRLVERYDVINIKLDKSGGLTESMRLADEAAARGLRLMVGCMGGSSLACAPALVLAERCEWVDLDSPMLLADDRVPGISYDRGVARPFTSELWG
jgi:L-alanine-DL-glutamate epimerase-like enolase superfamily enzyme